VLNHVANQVLTLPRIIQVRYVINRHPTGCAQAWNTVFRLYPNQPFWLLSANDIEFSKYPNALRDFYLETMRLEKRDKTVGMTSTAIDMGSIRKTFGLMLWSNTRQGVISTGLYDENMFPAYFEDDDIVWRHWLVKMRMVVFPDIIVLHGDGDKYVSGTKLEDKNGSFVKSVKRSLNEKYLSLKWGKSMTGINYDVLADAAFRETFHANCFKKEYNKYCTPFGIDQEFYRRYYESRSLTSPSSGSSLAGFWYVHLFLALHCIVLS